MRNNFFFSFSDENTAVNHTGAVTISQVAQENDAWRRPRSESSGDAESMYMTTNTVLSDSGYAHGPQSRRSSVSIFSHVFRLILHFIYMCKEKKGQKKIKTCTCDYIYDV